jgi:hypothetical protein
MMFPLGQMPSFEYTEEMRKKAFQDAIRQAGLGMMGAALGGARTGDAFGQGLLGGFKSYQQAPQMAQKQWMGQLESQKDWLSMNKSAAELQKMSREQKDYDKQQDFFSMLTNPGAASMAGGGGPSNSNLEKMGRYQNNPLAMLADPTIGIRGMQAGVDPTKLGAIAQNARPYKMEGGNFYVNPITQQREYLPSIDKNMMMDGQGRAMAVPGAQEAVNALRYGEKSGELAAQLNYDRARLPYDVQRAGGVANAEASARANYDPFTFTDDRGVPQQTTRGAFARGLNGAPSYRIDPAEQARRDAIAQGVYDSEGAGKFSPRLNDRPGAGLNSQVANLGMPSIAGQAPVTRAGVENTMKVLTEGREKVGVLRDSLEAFGQITEAIKGGAYQGRFADWQTSAAAVASAIPGLGDVLDPKKLANSEVAAKHLSEQVLARIKMLGANPSNADREYIEKTVAQLRNNPQAFSRLMNYTQSMMAKSIESHNAAADRFHKIKGAGADEIGMDFRVNIPDGIKRQREAIQVMLKEGTPEQRRQLMLQGWIQ